MTARDFEKSFSFNKTAEITGLVFSPIHIQTRHSKYVLYFKRYGS